MTDGSAATYVMKSDGSGAHKAPSNRGRQHLHWRGMVPASASAWRLREASIKTEQKLMRFLSFRTRAGGLLSAWLCGHGRAMPGCGLPIFDPLLPNSVSLFGEPVAWAMPALDHNYDAGVEFSLRMIDIR